MLRSRGRGAPGGGPAPRGGGGGARGGGRGARGGGGNGMRSSFPGPGQGTGPNARDQGEPAGAAHGRGVRPSGAMQLLQKASTQLRGERVPIKPREEDELANYLNTLTKKTEQVSKSMNYEEYGDISISSGADAMTPRVRRTPSPALGAGSKFLKKKPVPEKEPEPSVKKTTGAYGVKLASARSSFQSGATSKDGVDSEDDDDDDDDSEDDDEENNVNNNIGGFVKATASSGGPKFASRSSSVPTRRSGGQMSKALDKASALANKITQRSSSSGPLGRKRSSLLDSDTDESFGPKVRGKKRGAKSSGRTSRGSSSDNSVGHDGNKFMKGKKQAESAEVKVERPKSGGKSPVLTKASSRAVSPAGRNSFVTRRASSNVYLTSEEESLAEFIQGLSGSDESRGSRRQALKQASARRKQQISRSPSPSPSPNRQSRQKAESPRPSNKEKPKPKRSVFRRRSSVESVASERAFSPKDKIMVGDSISFNDPLELNLMDARTLGPIVLLTPEPASYSEQTKRSRSQKVRPSPFKKSNSPTPSQKKKSKVKEKKSEKKEKKKTKTSSVFQSFGVQSIEDLLGSDKDPTEESEITTEPIRSRRKNNQSVSEIVTQIGSRATPQRRVSYAYSEDFEPSISERIGENKGRGQSSRRTSVSSIATQYSDEDTGVEYTEEFASETISVAHDSDSQKSSHYSDDETQSEGSPRHARGRRVVVDQRSVEIQTAAPAGLSYQWLSQTGVSVFGPPLGLGAVDPTPIAATVISADALETMTAYSPATMAIHEMLKQQVELIKQFAVAHERLYQTLSDSNKPDFKYTTLEGTKAYIAKHRKPRLTMKEALKMVAQEMN